MSEKPTVPVVLSALPLVGKAVGIAVDTSGLKIDRDLLERIKVGFVEWDAATDINACWLPAGIYAKPFPWDGTMLTPVIDQAFMWLRARVILFDSDTENKAEFCDPLSVTPPVQISLPESYNKVKRPLFAKAQYGFHCSSCEDDTRYVVLVFRNSDDTQRLEIRKVPERDSAPIEQVVQGVLPPATDAVCCSLVMTDEVSLTLHYDDCDRQRKSFAVCVCSSEHRNLMAYALRLRQLSGISTPDRLPPLLATLWKLLQAP